MASRVKHPWELSVEERIKAAELAKNCGNLAYTDGKFEDAMAHYSKGLKLLIPAYKAQNQLKDVVASLKLSFYLNMSACQLKLKQFDYVISNCTKALEIDENSIKALYRRSSAFIELNDIEKAERDIKMGLAIDCDNIPFKKQQERLIIKARLLNERTKSMMKCFLQGSSKDGDHEEENCEKTK